MNTVIYLSNEEVRVVVFKRNGRKTVVDAVYSEKAPDGSIFNGQVMQEQEFTEFLRHLWDTYSLPKRRVTLMIGSARAVTKTIVIPKMNHRRIMEYLPREFASMEHIKDPVYTYQVFRGPEKRIRILAAMVERGFLERHIRRFERLGISVCSVSVGILTNLKWLRENPQIHGKTCVIQILDGRNLFSILFVKGDYYYFTSARIFGDRGTPAFGSEIGLAVGMMNQVLQAQVHGESITHVYLSSGFQKEDLEICRESVCRMEGIPEILMLGWDEVFLTELSDVFLFRDRKNLLYQYRRNSKEMRRFRSMVFCFAPAAALICLLAVPAAFQGAVWFYMSERADRLMNEAGSAELVKQAAAYDRLAAESELLDSRLKTVEQEIKYIRSYPVYTSQVRKRLDTCGGDTVFVELDHYDGSLGAVSVNVTVWNAADLAPFIDRLEMQTDLFASVGYEGFQYDRRERVWRSRVVCYLTEPDLESRQSGGSEVSP